MEPLVYTLSSAPAAEPVTRAELMEHLRETRSELGSLIDSLGVAARFQVENDTRRQLMKATYSLYLDSFASEIRLPRSPLLSVSSISYVDTDGATQTLDTSVYTVDTDCEPGRVYLAYGQTWPLLRDIPKAVAVSFIAGYSSSATVATQRAAVPAGLKAAIKLLTERNYDAPDDGGLEGRYRALIAPYVVPITNHALRCTY